MSFLFSVEDPNYEGAYAKSLLEPPKYSFLCGEESWFDKANLQKTEQKRDTFFVLFLLFLFLFLLSLAICIVYIIYTQRHQKIILNYDYNEMEEK